MIFDLLRLIISVALFVYMAANLVSFFGIGKKIDVNVIVNADSANAKVVELNIKNDSQKWLDYTFVGGSDIPVYLSDFTITDKEGNVLTSDGRSKINVNRLARGKQETIDLVFIDDNNNIKGYTALDISTDFDKIKQTIKLPKAKYIKSNEEVLQDAFFGNSSDKEKAAKEFRDRLSSEIGF